MSTEEILKKIQSEGSIELTKHSYIINKNGEAVLIEEDRKKTLRPDNKFVLLEYMRKPKAAGSPMSFSYKALELLKLYNLDVCIKWALEHDYIFIYKRPGQL